VAAAWVMKTIWERANNVLWNSRTLSGWDYTVVRERRRQQREADNDAKSSPYADWIADVIGELSKPESGEAAHFRALELAKPAFLMRHRDHRQTIQKLIDIDLRPRAKREFLIALVVGGEVVDADLISRCIDAFFEDAKLEAWRLRERLWELEDWLTLLVFSNRPETLVNAMKSLRQDIRAAMSFRRVLATFKYAPDLDVANVLAKLVEFDPSIAHRHEFLDALEGTETVAAAMFLVDLVSKAAFGPGSGNPDSWFLSQTIAKMMTKFREVRAAVYTFVRSTEGYSKTIFKRAIAEVADEEGFLVLAEDHARHNLKYGGELSMALRNVALKQIPVGPLANVYNMEPADLTGLRKKLFGWTAEDSPRGRLAIGCLIAIDQMHDDYGTAETEPRHPDVMSGRAWPLEAAS